MNEMKQPISSGKNRSKTNTVRKVFLSYSWDDNNHQEWVKQLAKDLCEENKNLSINTILDVNDLVLGDQITHFMEQSIANSDYVIIICTPMYKKKADNRTGGVGYEDSIITGELYNRNNQRKYIPILARGSWTDSIPTWAIGKLGVDMTTHEKYLCGLEKLKETIKKGDLDDKPLNEKSQRHSYSFHSPQHRAIQGESPKMKQILTRQGENTSLSSERFATTPKTVLNQQSPKIAPPKPAPDIQKQALPHSEREGNPLSVFGIIMLVLFFVGMLILNLPPGFGRKTLAITQITAGRKYTAVIRSDGSLSRTGYTKSVPELDVNHWENIEEISSGGDYILGLHTDGTVVKWGQFFITDTNAVDVSNWSEIVSISAGEEHAVGIRRDGTLIASGANWSGQCDVGDWAEIASASAGGTHTVALRNDGTVVATGENQYGQCNVSEWRNIVAVSAGGSFTVGLLSDGTVVAVGDNRYGQCDLEEWKDIIAVSAGDSHVLGLCSDGTVLSAGSNSYGQCDVTNWKDITAICAGAEHSVGLLSDGTLTAVGRNDDEHPSSVELLGLS